MAEKNGKTASKTTGTRKTATKAASGNSRTAASKASAKSDESKVVKTRASSTARTTRAASSAKTATPAGNGEKKGANGSDEKVRTPNRAMRTNGENLDIAELKNKTIKDLIAYGESL